MAASSVILGVWGRVEVHGDRDGAVRLGCERLYVLGDKPAEVDVQKETTAFSLVYSFMPRSSLWGFTKTCGCKSNCDCVL